MRTQSPTDPVRFAQVSGGNNHSLGLGSDGAAYAWGYNYYGQLGDGTTNQRNTPARVGMPAGVAFTAVSAGGNHSMALDRDGNIWTWGYNGSGQLGDGTTTNRTTPVKAATPAGVAFTAISAGGNHSMALDRDGNIWTWGYNGYRQLGDGTTTTNRTTPVRVAMPDGTAFTAISAGYRHSLALTGDGTAYAWGYN
ncbi:RCC1 domain-containing protein, partial [Bifidobacterium indicum]|uniref:RCC1 domain-containing protein n=1 Tax=Bifidobacterium indicum TaxID=1691 RepID=UPI003BB74676